MRSPTRSLPHRVEFAANPWSREISREHAHIFFLLGMYLRQARSGSVPPRLLPLIDSIASEVSVHCRAEEAACAELGQPDLAVQSQSHRRIMEQLAQLGSHLAAGRDVPQEVYEQLFDALMIHQIRDADSHRDSPDKLK